MTNKNILVIGGSGSGKTRFFIKPNIMQCLPPEATKDGKGKGYSIVVTDPKGTLVLETGKLLKRCGYNIKIFNTINFKKSMHYNRATCSPPKMRRIALFSFSSVN